MESRPARSFSADTLRAASRNFLQLVYSWWRSVDKIQKRARPDSVFFKFEFHGICSVTFVTKSAGSGGDHRHAIGGPPLLIGDVEHHVRTRLTAMIFSQPLAIIPPRKCRENWKCQQRG
jgi:hypothetical protein